MRLGEGNHWLEAVRAELARGLPHDGVEGLLVGCAVALTDSEVLSVSAWKVTEAKLIQLTRSPFSPAAVEASLRTVTRQGGALAFRAPSTDLRGRTVISDAIAIACEAHGEPVGALVIECPGTATAELLAAAARVGEEIALYLDAGMQAPEDAVAPYGEIEDALLDLPRGEGTILVFDDEDNVRMAAGLMLEELGYSVIEAENGRIALELADAHAGKIVGAILDVRDDRGGMDGEEVLRRLRPAHPNLPVVVCTGDATEVTRMEPHGIHAVLLKPFTLEELAGAIAQAVVAPQR